MNVPFQQAIALCNAGAALLRNNDNLASLTPIRQAMILVRDSGRISGGSIGTAASRGCNTATDHQDETFFCGADFESEKTFGNPVTTDSGSGFSVYDSPLCIPPVLYIASSLLPADDSQTLNALHRLISVVLLFNKALAHRRLCQVASGPWSTHRKAAVALYDVLLGLLDTCHLTDDSSFWVVCKCLVLNNRSNLYYEDLEYTKSQACLEELYALNLVYREGLLEAHLGVQVTLAIYLNVMLARPAPPSALAA